MYKSLEKNRRNNGKCDNLRDKVATYKWNEKRHIFNETCQLNWVRSLDLGFDLKQYCRNIGHIYALRTKMT